MGSSWVSLGEVIPDDQRSVWHGKTYGFWAKDGPLIDWYAAMGEVITANAAAPDWLKELGAHWLTLNELSGAGYVPDQLKESIVDEQRRLAVIEAASDVMQRALDSGGDYYRAFPSTMPKCTCGKCPTPSLTLGQKIGFLEVGSNFARLLCGFTKHGQASSGTFGISPDAKSYARVLKAGGDPTFWRK